MAKKTGTKRQPKKGIAQNNPKEEEVQNTNTVSALEDENDDNWSASILEAQVVDSDEKVGEKLSGRRGKQDGAKSKAKGKDKDSGKAPLKENKAKDITEVQEDKADPEMDNVPQHEDDNEMDTKENVPMKSAKNNPGKATDSKIMKNEKTVKRKGKAHDADEKIAEIGGSRYPKRHVKQISYVGLCK